MPFSDPVFTHIKQMVDIFISKDVDEPIFEPSIHLQLEVGDVIMFPWFVFQVPLCQNDLFLGARICFFKRCQNMSASFPTTVLARRLKRDNLLTANHFKWCSQYYCHKTQNLNQIMLISIEECNCLLHPPSYLHICRHKVSRTSK